jgi:hypothetical protein
MNITPTFSGPMHQPSIPQNSDKCDGITTSVFKAAGIGTMIGTLAALTISGYYGEINGKELLVDATAEESRLLRSFAIMLSGTVAGGIAGLIQKIVDIYLLDKD